MYYNVGNVFRLQGRRKIQSYFKLNQQRYQK